MWWARGYDPIVFLLGILLAALLLVGLAAAAIHGWHRWEQRRRYRTWRQGHRPRHLRPGRQVRFWRFPRR